jgi:adenylate cyclase class 2
MPLEIEVKFLIEDRRQALKKILALGAVSEGRVFESNVRFDDREDSLMRQGALLRLRRDTRAILTHKSKPARPDGRFKVYNEREVEVSDFAAMQQILESLGFHPRQIYEKWRETFKLDHAHLCLDEMPFGVFLEIEADPDEIQGIAAALGLAWRRRILMTYLQIFASLKEALALPFSDLTFANFKAARLDGGTLRKQLEAILTGN